MKIRQSKFKSLFLASISGFILLCYQVKAQDSSLSEVDVLENEFNKKNPVPVLPESSALSDPNKIENENSEKKIQTGTIKKTETISENLDELAPFSEISVLQLKYLPKTSRFQFFGGVGSMMNDPWYNNFGLNLKFAYHFTETWGLELTYMPFSSSEKDTTKKLFESHGVAARSFVTVKSYTGADIIWSPIYGKMASSRDKIVPFDMYFAFGGGQAKIDNGDGGSAFHASTGQIFAINKSMAFRWDFGWHMFNATPVGRSAQTFSSLILSAGFSFFFPGAKYR